MASYTELTILREEERVLMKVASKLNDQLNRLKVGVFRFLYKTGMTKFGTQFSHGLHYRLQSTMIAQNRAT